MNIPDNRDQGQSRISHLRKVIARDAIDDQITLRTPPEVELEKLSAYMDAKYPGWDDPAPLPEIPQTLKACKRLVVRLRTRMTGDGVSKRTRTEIRTQLNRLELHMRETFPE